MTKAARHGLVRTAQLITGENHGYNFHQEMISEIQKAKSRMVYMDFDFDCDTTILTVDNLKSILDSHNVINLNALHILESRGGYHLLVKIDDVEYGYKNRWYQNVKAIQKQFSSDCLNKGNNMMPIPGCTQGNFIPHFIL